MSNKGRSCGCKGSGSRKSRERFYNSQDFMVNCFKVRVVRGCNHRRTAGTSRSRNRALKTPSSPGDVRVQV